MFCLCVCILMLCMSGPLMSKEGHTLSDRGKDDCEPPCESWSRNPGHEQEQQGLVAIEPSLQPALFFCLNAVPSPHSLWCF